MLQMIFPATIVRASGVTFSRLKIAHGAKLTRTRNIAMMIGDNVAKSVNAILFSP